MSQEKNDEITEELNNFKISEEQTSDDHDEYQYLNLIEKIIKTGAKKNDRTGVGTYSIFGTHMRFNLQDGMSLFTFFNDN